MDFIYFRFGVGGGVVFVLYLILLWFVCLFVTIFETGSDCTSLASLGSSVRVFLFRSLEQICLYLVKELKGRETLQCNRQEQGPLRHSRQNQL